jgi:2-polyprenyl-3-methyl-5-hydroxy-6-metoxy-1,4-benzoquinol methylase
MVDIGSFHQDSSKYKKLIDDLYASYPPVTLPPEYAYFIEKDLLRFLIRLARYKFVARMIKKKDRVLEVGCGSGMGSIFLSQHCAHVSGLDVKSTEIDEAKSINRRGNVEFKAADLFKLDPAKKYDVVVALDVIEHMSVEKARKLIAGMRLHLKRDGMLVIGTPSLYSYEHQSSLSRASHVKCYDQNELTALLDKYFCRTIAFSMNDEIVHTGFSKMAWYYFILAFSPKRK